MSLAKQLNGIRRMIVNKKDKASVFWWEETKNSAVPASNFFRHINNIVKKCKETLDINRISQKIREAYLHILKAAPAAERGILGVNGVRFI